MLMSKEESLAVFRVMVYVARADNDVHAEERAALQAALDALELPAGVDVDWMLAEPTDLELIIKDLERTAVRQHAYAAAYSMACVDSDCVPDERVVLARLRGLLGISDRVDAFFARLYLPAHQQPGPSMSVILDALLRDGEMQSIARKTAVASAIAVHAELPGREFAIDLVLARLQISLTREVAALWGRELDDRGATGLLAEFGAGFGEFLPAARQPSEAAEQARPPSQAYASAFAVGRAVHSHIQSGARVPGDRLRGEFHRAREAGESAYEADAEHVAAAVATHQGALKDLAAGLAAGTLEPEAFAQQVLAMAGGAEDDDVVAYRGFRGAAVNG